MAYIQNASGDLSPQTLVVAGAGGGELHLASVSIATATTGLLSSATAILRWNDGIANRSESVQIQLTTAGAKQEKAVPVLLGSSQSLTVEVDVTGANGSWLLAAGSTLQ